MRREFCPWEWIARHNIRLERRVIDGHVLGPDVLGYSDVGLIVIDSRLSDVQARSTAAHECGHQALGHVDLPGSPIWQARREIAADNWAARRLIPLDHLGCVLSVTRSETRAADMLGVDPELLGVRLDMAEADPFERGYLASHTKKESA